MLDEPPKTRFNVTQSFALFSTVLLWTKNRAWVGGDREDRPPWFGQADHAARDARERLRDTRICEAPWLLSLTSPQVIALDRQQSAVEGYRINSDFAEMRAEVFFKWLRDALAHGDGRTIRPIHKFLQRRGKTLLTGFEVVFAERRGVDRDLTLALYHTDMRRIGSILADIFCQSLSGGDRYFEREAGTAAIEEGIRVA
jgi:hypothetical protein